MSLRQEVIDAYENKEGSIRQLAQRFKVSPKFVHELLQRYRQEGTIEPKPHAGGPAPRLQDEHLKVLQEWVEQDNDATLEQLADRLFERTQSRVSVTTLHRALNKLNLTRKKRRSKPAKLML
ncbi:MAG: transposase [Cyanothece sp. SIO1E1]|nr:transposase [Cyanothece sp. SIO1E1]